MKSKMQEQKGKKETKMKVNKEESKRSQQEQGEERKRTKGIMMGHYKTKWIQRGGEGQFNLERRKGRMIGMGRDGRTKGGEAIII